MLDTLESAWAESNNGKSIWTDSTVRFVDPFTKSGVFLREITKRLLKGLEHEFPNLQQRVDQILTNQVFGVATAPLEALIARRSVYCAKFANGQHSISTKFTDEQGNIKFQAINHSWGGGKTRVLTANDAGDTIEITVDGKCVYCGANQRDYDREELENYAYPFLHTNNPNQFLNEIFGTDMKFDVVIGNPPYQLGQSGGESVGGFAMPIYQKFVRSAKSLEPRFICMITPSRWFAGGRGLDDFRAEMLSDRRIRSLCDFPNAKEVFPGTQIEGGVSYFLWDANWNAECTVQTFEGGVPTSAPMPRFLNTYDVLVRRNDAIPILEKVIAASSTRGSIAEQVFPIQPFGLRTNFLGETSPNGMRDPILLYRNGGTAFVESSDIQKNREITDRWKVLLGAAYGSSGSAPIQVYNTPIVAAPRTACTETYLVIGTFDTEPEARNFAIYLSTKFVRYLVSLKKNTQHLYSERFSFVPNLTMEQTWTDELLYDEFALSEQERNLINSTIREMEFERD